MAKEKPSSLERAKKILGGAVKHPVVAVVWGHLNYLPVCGLLLKDFLVRAKHISSETVDYNRAAAVCGLLPRAGEALQELWPEMDPRELERYRHPIKRPEANLPQFLRLEFSKESPFVETGFRVNPHELLDKPPEAFVFPPPIARRKLPGNNKTSA